MSTQVTVTGKTGPGVTVTAAVYTDVQSFSVNANNAILTLYTNSGQTIQVDIAGKTTFTVTAVGTAAPMSYTVSIS